MATCYEEIGYSGLERLIKEVYGHYYEIPPGEEIGPNAYMKVDVSKQRKISEYNTMQLEKFKATGNGSFILDTLMQDMCNNGKLEPANYLIEIDW